MQERIDDAHAVLDVLASVGVMAYDVTLKRLDEAEENIFFQRGVSTERLRRMVPSSFECADRMQQSVIIRPSRSSSAVVIQCDDVTDETLELVRDEALFGLTTSIGNHQVWFSVPREDYDDTLARGLKRRLNADMTASGAMRIPGSRNFKRKYAPEYPLVRCMFVQPGRTTRKDILEQRGFLAGTSTYVARGYQGRGKRWPDYGRCLAGAPMARDGKGVDVSRADFVWCMTAASWGWGEHDIAERLGELSEKAKRHRGSYAALTAQKASIAVGSRSVV